MAANVESDEFLNSVFCFCLSLLAGLGEKVNDSLDMMFDTTAYGEYKSFGGTQLEQSQPSQVEQQVGQETEEEDKEGEEEEGEEDEDAEKNGGSSVCDIKKNTPTLVG